MQFKMCPTNSPFIEATQECLDQNVLEIYGYGPKYPVKSEERKITVKWVEPLNEWLAFKIFYFLLYTINLLEPTCHPFTFVRIAFSNGNIELETIGYKKKNLLHTNLDLSFLINNVYDVK